MYGLICLVTQISIDIKRIKDLGKNRKWIFINLVPIIGLLIWWPLMGFGKSGRGKNNLFEIKVSQLNLTPQYLLC